MRHGLSYETKLKRFQEVQARKKARAEKRVKEQQEKENRKLMSQSHRREVAKKLKEKIDTTTDPETLIRLANALAKVSPKKRGRPVEKIVAKKVKPPVVSQILDGKKGSMLDSLCDGEKVLCHIIKAVEAKRREMGRVLTKAEQDAFLNEARSHLFERERVALEEYEAGFTS